MWTCEKCGRSFHKTNQSHSCGRPEPTIEAYIDSQPEAVRPVLHALHQAIQTAIPQAEQRMSWGMPTYWQQGNIIHFVAHAKHVGIHIGSDVLAHFQDRLALFKTGKGSIQFPFDKPVPYDFIAEMARWSYEQLHTGS